MTDDCSTMIRHPDAIELHWPRGGVSFLPYLWLRDNCACQECRVAQTAEKKFIISSVPVNLQPDELAFVNDRLNLTWPDGHLSYYSGSELRAFKKEELSPRTYWDAEFRPRETDYQTFLGDHGAAVDMIKNFMEYGAAILDGAPVQPGTLETLTPRLGPVHEVMFDRIHDVKIDATGYNVAHTALELPPHNDFASYSWPPSVQALHMLANEAPGGASVIVDGWYVLENYRDEHPVFFESLCSMPVPFRMFDEDVETRAEAPLVSCNTEGQIVGLRFSNQLMQAMNPNQQGVAMFYRAYHELCLRVTKPAAKASFRLKSGQILLLAGHRVLHGRDAFKATGKRHLQDAYFELDNVKNQLPVLKRKIECTNG